MNQNELELEKHFIDELVKLGWEYVSPELLNRTGIDEPLLEIELDKRIRLLNKKNDITDTDVKRVINELKFASTSPEGAKKILSFYKQGIPVKYENDGVVRFTKIFDYENITNNSFTISSQVIHSGAESIKNDILLYVNGIPLVDIELKDPTNPAESWRNACNQIIDYFSKIPELYKYVQIGVGANSNARYFPITQWRNDYKTYEWKSEEMDSVDSVIQMLKPETLLEIVKNFLFVRVEKGEFTKVIARYMQMRAVNKIVDRVISYNQEKSDKNKGLIWHWQGSGKTFEIISAANILQNLSTLENPTQFLLIDREDLETQLATEYHALDMASPKVIGSIDELKKVISADSFRGMRGVFIVLMHKFRPGDFEEISEIIKASAHETISKRKNVICFIDEGHRSQYGLLASQMKSILKNAFFFAFTGTPVSKTGKSTYNEFSYPPEETYLDKYFISESIADGFTKKITYKPRLDELHLDRKKLEDFLKGEYDEIPDDYREEVKEGIRRKLNTINVFLEDRRRIKLIAEDIAMHFRENVEGNYKAMVVTASRKACVRYKRAIDEFFPASYSDIVMTYDPTHDADDEEIYGYMNEIKKKYHRTDINEITDKVISDFKDEKEPKILIVTEMLLTGFDAPVLQTMYLDKPLKEQRLLQAIARTNRPYQEKESGLIIDYVGIFDRIEKAFAAYSKEDIQSAILNMENLASDFVKMLNELMTIFDAVPKDFTRQTLQKTIEIITSDKKIEDKFKNKYNQLRRLYEFLGSDEVKLQNLKNYKWLSAIHTNYIKVVTKDETYQDYLNMYFKRTLNLIHDETEVKEIVDMKVETVINEAFIKKVEEKVKDKKEQASNLVFALNKFVLVDKHKNPVYESLIERVEALVKKWRERIADEKEILEEAKLISGEIVEIQKTQRELGLTDKKMSIWLFLKESLNIEVDKDLLDSISNLIDDLEKEMIPGWTKNTELKKSVETKLRQFLFMKVKTKYPITLEKINEIHDVVSEKLVSYRA